MQLPQKKITYTVIAFQFDPVTDTDLVSTRQEVHCSTLPEAQKSQEQLADNLIQEKVPFRSYIQERETYNIQVSKKSKAEQYRVKKIHNFIEFTGD